MFEEEHEVVLHEEAVVTEKGAVPVERVGLTKETVTDETVSEEVRKEKVDTDVDENLGKRGSVTRASRMWLRRLRDAGGARSWDVGGAWLATAS